MHIKRLAANRHIKLPRKVRKFAISIIPGKHPKDEAIPLGYVVRDLLGYALSYKEARKAVGHKNFMIDGKIADDIKTPVGFMDVIEVVPTGERYRVVYDDKGLLRLVKISAEQAKLKIGKIKNKHITKGGKIQLTLHDGRNILMDFNEGNKYKVGDSVVIEIEGQAIKDHLPYKEGNLVMIVRGKWAGKVGKIKEIEHIRGLEPNKVVIEQEDGTIIRTLKDYAFVIGRDEPAVKIKE